MSRHGVTAKSRRQRKGRGRSKGSISPWRLTRAQAKALDALLAFETHEEAAEHLGVSVSTLRMNLKRAFRSMRATGADLVSDGRGMAIQASVLWLTYWWSDEGKAALRNPQLTRDPLA